MFFSQENGKTALHKAVSAGKERIAKLLIDYGADVNAKDKTEWTPLHCAVRTDDNKKIIRLLLKDQNVQGSFFVFFPTPKIFCLKVLFFFSGYS